MSLRNKRCNNNTDIENRLHNDMSVEFSDSEDESDLISASLATESTTNNVLQYQFFDSKHENDHISASTATESTTNNVVQSHRLINSMSPDSDSDFETESKKQYNKTSLLSLTKRKAASTSKVHDKSIHKQIKQKRLSQSNSKVLKNQNCNTGLFRVVKNQKLSSSKCKDDKNKQNNTKRKSHVVKKLFNDNDNRVSNISRCMEEVVEKNDSEIHEINCSSRTNQNKEIRETQRNNQDLNKKHASNSNCLASDDETCDSNSDFVKQTNGNIEKSKKSNNYSKTQKIQITAVQVVQKNNNQILKKNCNCTETIKENTNNPGLNEGNILNLTNNNETNSRRENSASVSKNYLKRPHNVSTQTNLDKDQPISNKRTEIDMSPTKLTKVDDNVCPFIYLLKSCTKKIDNEINLKELCTNQLQRAPLSNTVSQKSVSNVQQINHKKKTVSSNTVSKKSPSSMKQLKMTELNFCKNKRASQNSETASYSSETASQTSETASNKSPKQADKSNKTPEKKEKRYSKDSHNEVYENVKKICQWIFGNEYFSILFTKSETDLLKKLFDLSDQRLTVICIRLFTRQDKWYNFRNLCEELNLTYEGFNLKEFLSKLTLGFVSTDYSKENIETLMDYLTLQNVKDICHSYKIKFYSCRKQELIKKLLTNSKQQSALTSLKKPDQILRDFVKDKLGICIKLNSNVKDILNRVHLLYSLTSPDLETPNDIYFLMIKIRKEIVKYPKTNVNSIQLFSDRQNFLNFVQARILSKEFFDEIGNKNILSQHLLCIEAHKRFSHLIKDDNQLELDKKKPLFLRSFSATHVYCKVLSVGSQNLGRLYADDVCTWLTDLIEQNIYCIQKRGEWYSQLALVRKAHQKDIEGEVRAITDGLIDKDVNEVRKYELSIRGFKIPKRKLSNLVYDQLRCSLLPEIEIPNSRTIKANVVHNTAPGRKVHFVKITEQGKEYTSVEQTAYNYYITEQNYLKGIHCEGHLLNGLFILFFWDIMYMHVPNTFITEIQNMPLDLFSGEFYENRKQKIESRLKNVRHDWTLDNICMFASKILSEHNLEFKSVINSEFFDENTLHIIIRCIGNNLLAAIFERFAKDYKQFRSGLPDLFMWNNRELKCCFVEVKSENDKLSANQILWINYLHKFGATVEVCHVEHIGSSSKKKNKN